MTLAVNLACTVGLLAVSAHLLTWARRAEQADRARCTDPHCRTCQILRMRTKERP